MNDILSGSYTKKIDFLFCVEYKFLDSLEDEKYTDLIASSHGNIYKICSHETCDENTYEIFEFPPEKTNELFSSYNQPNENTLYRIFYLIPLDAIYFEENRQDYHKMHFDILSNDGCKGIMLFKNKMIEIDPCEMESIFKDMQKYQIEEIIDYYKNEKQEIDEYIKQLAYDKELEDYMYDDMYSDLER